MHVERYNERGISTMYMRGLLVEYESKFSTIFTWVSMLMACECCTSVIAQEKLQQSNITYMDGMDQFEVGSSTKVVAKRRGGRRFKEPSTPLTLDMRWRWGGSIDTKSRGVPCATQSLTMGKG